jgi:hypothetical protein
LIDAYYDARWHAVLDPLYEQFQRWKAGALTHADLDEAIHQAHRQSQELFAFFRQRRDHLVAVIPFDRDWFEPWVAAHPAPPAGDDTPAPEA